MSTNYDAMIDTLTDIGDVDPALARMALGLAAAVDADASNAALWREYRAVVATIREAAAHVDDDDTAEFMLSVSAVRRAAVRNATD